MRTIKINISDYGDLGRFSLEAEVIFDNDCFEIFIDNKGCGEVDTAPHSENALLFSQIGSLYGDRYSEWLSLQDGKLEKEIEELEKNLNRLKSYRKKTTVQGE